MNKTRILIVDDEKDMVDVICEVLSTSSYELLTALSGEEALQIIEKQTVDIVLLDLNMPGIGGYEVCRRIKKLTEGALTPIIVLSSNSQEVDKVAALSLGAVDYITKPFSPGELRARVQTQLKLKNMHEDLYKQRSAMSKLVIHDELTGIYNRRYLLTRLDEELARASRYRSPLVCMMMDIDDFKMINDTHGHQAGDVVLKGISVLLRNFVRETDVVARYGGEEFVIILPETDIPGAVAFAERLMESIRNHTFTYQDKNLNVTMSIGISSNQNTEISKETLINEADTCLYKAKNEGKNRIKASSWQ
ncbi:MAG: diguanylate cyclase [Elusimicrobia bacterium]|nr:diguanylate cyclase [Elusimicrobiota bacterium]MBD3412143.1 diguanylate cyclase [Elusimicrobiota bacterium]